MSATATRAARMRVVCALALAAAGGCDAGGGPALDPAEQARRQLEALSVPGRSLGVESFTDNDNLAVLAPALYPEVATLLTLGPGAGDPLAAALTDPKLEGNEDGDRVRALAAFALERVAATAALPALRAYLGRALALGAPPFFSIQTSAHALAVLSGQTARVRSLYGYDEVEALIAPGSAGALVVNGARGNPVEHRHLIGPAVPPAAWTSDLAPGLVQARNQVFTMKLDGFARFDDAITVRQDATRSYGCHSFTFRRDDTLLPDPAARYHVLGEAVPGLLRDEGLTDVTSSPALWHAGDVVVFYDPSKSAEVPIHSGRLSSGGIALTDPALRFTSKWSVTLPVVDVSVRDAMKLYGQRARIYAKVVSCAAEVRAGGNTACAVRADGTVWCWGSNQFGQLGNGTTTDSATPVQVQGLAGAIDVAVGQGFACAARADSAWCWGGNTGGTLGDGTEQDRSMPVQVSGLSAPLEVAASGTAACARRGDGSVFCWGGALGRAPVRMVTAGPAPNNPPQELHADELRGGAGGFSARGLDGRLWGWDGSRGDFPGDSGSSWTLGATPLLANGAYPVTAAKSDLGSPPTLFAGAAGAGAVGRLHACVIGAGAVSCWGANEHGQLGRVTADKLYSYPARVAGLGAAAEVAAGDDHACARTIDASVWCWGGQTAAAADGTLADSVQPALVMAGVAGNHHSLAGGARHTCALAPDGVWCWGSNLFGQLGTGADGTALTASARPVRALLPCP